MDASGIVTAVQNLGISVVMCLLMAWFVKYMFDKFMTQQTEEKEAHKAEINLLKDALSNNTLAITTLAERLKENVGN